MVVWLSWYFVRFREILLQTDAESCSFLSWKTKKFIPKKLFRPLSISKQKSFVYSPNFRWRFCSVQQLWNSGSPSSSQYEKLMHVYRSMSEVLFVAPDRCCKMLREKCASRKSKVKWVHKLFEEVFFLFMHLHCHG